jgi:hypothetical protein
MPILTIVSPCQDHDSLARTAAISAGGNTVERWYIAEHNRDVVVPASFQGEGDPAHPPHPPGQGTGLRRPVAAVLPPRRVVPEPAGSQQQDPPGSALYHCNMLIDAQIACAASAGGFTCGVVIS